MDTKETEDEYETTSRDEIRRLEEDCAREMAEFYADVKTEQEEVAIEEQAVNDPYLRDELDFRAQLYFRAQLDWDNERARAELDSLAQFDFRDELDWDNEGVGNIPDTYSYNDSGLNYTVLVERESDVPLDSGSEPDQVESVNEEDEKGVEDKGYEDDEEELTYPVRNDEELSLVSTQLTSSGVDEAPSKISYATPNSGSALPDWLIEARAMDAAAASAEKIRHRKNGPVYLLILVGIVGLIIHAVIVDNEERQAREAERARWTPYTRTIHTIQTDEDGKVLNTESNEIDGWISNDGTFRPRQYE